MPKLQHYLHLPKKFIFLLTSPVHAASPFDTASPVHATSPAPSIDSAVDLSHDVPSLKVHNDFKVELMANAKQWKNPN
jgi:hypothetical protein